MKYGYARVSTHDQVAACATYDLITVLDDLKPRGVKFRSLTEHIDTDTATGRAMWQMIGVLAELELSDGPHATDKIAVRRAS